MSVKKLPDYRLKQKILHIDKASPETLSRYGDLYLEDGAPADALDFYARGANRLGMEKIKALALETGDAFLLQNAAKALGEEPREADWEALARRATDLGKYLFAQHALEKTNNAELLNTVVSRIKAEEAKQSA